MAEAYLAGKHAVVTGGGRGIGATIAAELADLGARVSLLGRNTEQLEGQVTRLPGEALAIQCDVADEQSVHQAFAVARGRFGDPYVLVNNAGQAESVAFTDMPRELWDRMLAVNLTGTMLCTQQVLPAMLGAGGGRVINIASTAGLRGYTKTAAYCAAKHAVIGLTRALALETARAGITVNAVCPGYTDTDMAWAAVDGLVAKLGITADEALATLTRINPQRRLVQPEEVASAVGWLCAPESAAVTGQAIAVAGGEVM
jgi:NAD(P)-dependent dehydrogenase (short-subunit alcohol dehydrogenase family)